MEKKIFPNTIIQSVALIFLSLILASPFVFAVTNKVSHELEILILGSIFILVFLSTVYIINRKRKIKLSFNFKLSNVPFIPLMIAVVIAFEFGFNVPINRVLKSIFGNGGNGANPFGSVSLLFGSLIIGPILEEILFRGIILKGLLASYTARKAIIASAIIFGAFHAKPILIPNAIAFGLFSGWIYYKTNNIGATIMLHIIANLFGTIGTYIHYKYGSASVNSIFDFYGSASLFIILFSSIAFIFSFLYLYRKMKTINVGNNLDLS